VSIPGQVVIQSELCSVWIHVSNEEMLTVVSVTMQKGYLGTFHQLSIPAYYKNVDISNLNLRIVLSALPFCFYVRNGRSRDMTS
jgi:hypothetical protein